MDKSIKVFTQLRKELGKIKVESEKIGAKADKAMAELIKLMA